MVSFTCQLVGYSDIIMKRSGEMDGEGVGGGVGWSRQRRRERGKAGDKRERKGEKREGTCKREREGERGDHPTALKPR